MKTKGGAISGSATRHHAGVFEPCSFISLGGILGLKDVDRPTNRSTRGRVRRDIGDYQTRGLPVHELNFGGSYWLTQCQQIDFHAGFGLNRNSPNYFVCVGYLLRLDGLWYS
jgi:hypothetical protein